MAATAKAPWHLWVVGVLTLIWNAYGGYDYVMTQLGDRAYLAPLTEPYGVDVDDALAWFGSFPVWVEFAWGLAIWSSVAGSLLLLLRKGWAAYAFALSLAGFLVATFWQQTHPLPGMSDGTVARTLTGAVALLLVLQLFYARRQTARGVLG